VVSYLIRTIYKFGSPPKSQLRLNPQFITIIVDLFIYEISSIVSFVKKLKSIIITFHKLLIFIGWELIHQINIINIYWNCCFIWKLFALTQDNRFLIIIYLIHTECSQSFIELDNFWDLSQSQASGIWSPIKLNVSSEVLIPTHLEPLNL
jgi:hypothetical protein